MKNEYITKCLCCNSNQLSKILDLNYQPLANSYSDSAEALPKFPLQLNLCTKCFHCQLSYAVDPDLMFKNYLYVSGTSNTLIDYFEWFAKKTQEDYPTAKTVLDIACNDGSQLNSYKKIGFNTFGIDPAQNLHDTSTKNGHKILCDYFNDTSVSELFKLSESPNFDIITAQNVFAHNTYPCDFLKLCKKIMHEKSKLYIQTSQANMIVDNQFDTIYHEHISFFNTNSMKKLVENSGLYLNDVFITPIHGNSYVFVIGKTKNETINVTNKMKSEESEGLYNPITYLNYAERCHEVAESLEATIKKYKDDGYKVIGYGAAAKGVVLINFAKLDLDFIVDDNKLKHGLCIPGTNIKIYEPKKLAEMNASNVLILPLAWNFYEEIKNKTLNILNKKTTFIKYFPVVKAELECP